MFELTMEKGVGEMNKEIYSNKKSNLFANNEPINQERPTLSQ